MKIIETKKYTVSKGPNMKTLKKNRRTLTEEEYRYIMDTPKKEILRFLRY